MKTLLFLAFLFGLFLVLISPSEAKVNCKKHTIYCQIKKNQPNIKHKRAMKLSNIIYKYAKKYRINKKLITAILMQESRYRLVAGNCSRGYKKLNRPLINEYGDPILYEYVPNKVCLDFGIGQINERNIRKKQIDINKLMTDLDYSVHEAVKVLKWFKRYKKKERYWWTRYNARTPYKRDIYRNFVERWM